MSLILEALKKSEAERRIGEAPGLLSPSAAITTTRRTPRNWLWIVLVLLLAPALAAAWWLGRMGGAETSTGNDSASVADAGTTASPPEPRVATASKRPDANQRANEAVVPQPAAAPPRAGPGNPPPRTTPAAQTPTAKPPAVPTPRAPGERESLPVMPGELPTSPPDQAMPEQAMSTPTRGSDAAIETSPATTAQEAPRETLPTLRQLDSATRGELPPLRISMHVFTDAPDGRFVIIDNHRYAEGASVASGLNIAEIRRNGVVMDYRGRRFLLDRPG